MKKLVVALREQDAPLLAELVKHFECVSINRMFEAAEANPVEEPTIPWRTGKIWWPQVHGAIDGILDMDDLAGVLVWNSAQPLSRAMCLAAQKRKRPAIDLDSHGCLSTYLHGHFESDPAADHVITSPEMCAFLDSYGYRGRLYAAGRPQYDSWGPIDRSLMRRSLGLPLDLPIVLRTSTWTHSMSAWSRMEECFIYPEQSFIAAMLAIQKTRPVVVVYSARLERGVNTKKLSESLAQVGMTNGYVTNDTDLVDLIGAADVVVSPKSSAAAEAVLIGRPAIIADFRPQLDSWAWEGKGIVPVRKPEEMAPRIMECLLDETTQARLTKEREKGKDWFFGPRPALKGVTERIVQICSS